MRILIIVQARMTSSRLPGKVLKEVLGKSLLEYQIERLKRVNLADETIIATTTNETDQPIIQLCKKLSIKYFRGSEDDVLSRYYNTAKQYRGDIIVRITSDCPLIDSQVINEIIKFYLEHQGKYDYISNTLIRSYPRGMDTEIFSFQALKEAFLEAKTKPEREHVTPFIHRQPDRYNLASVCYSQDQSQYRWTVDTMEDFELIKKILEALYPSKNDFSMEDCLQLLVEHPDWVEINKHIEQKKI